MSKHTPGPWRCDKAAAPWNIAPRIYSTERNVEVARVSTDCQRNDSEVNLANARLIAAAPELLAALRSLLIEYDHHVPDDCNCIRVHLVADAAREAIAKATGADNE